eukprot:5710804-Pleurochrysis_carterae.AAC.1
MSLNGRVRSSAARRPFLRRAKLRTGWRKRSCVQSERSITRFERSVMNGEGGFAPSNIYVSQTFKTKLCKSFSPALR